MPCAIGRGGIVAAKREGDGATPTGRFALRRVYWRADRGPRPTTSLPCAPIGPHLGWSDDPADSAYNGPVPLDRRCSAERMRRGDPLYDIVVDMDFNRSPAIPFAGSAIFLHVWRKPRHPTEGCIAFAAPDLRWILMHWTPQSRVVIRQP